MICVHCSKTLDKDKAVRKSPICHCRLCKKCFKNYCENLARNVSVSEFICPGCSFPDVNANPDEALMYFEYLSQQIKALHLNPILITLIESKIMDWKVRTLPDHYKRAHSEKETSSAYSHRSYDYQSEKESSSAFSDNSSDYRSYRNRERRAVRPRTPPDNRRQTNVNAHCHCHCHCHCQRHRQVSISVNSHDITPIVDVAAAFWNWATGS